jgi:hypothetical protein
MWRIGVLGFAPTTADMVGPDPKNAFTKALLLGLRELGYVCGQHFVTEPRGAEGKRDAYPGLVADLIRLQVDVKQLVPTAAPVAVLWDLLYPPGWEAAQATARQGQWKLLSLPLRVPAARMMACGWTSRSMPARTVEALMLTPSSAEAPTSALATGRRTQHGSATYDHPLARPPARVLLARWSRHSRRTACVRCRGRRPTSSGYLPSLDSRARGAVRSELTDARRSHPPSRPCTMSHCCARRSP